MEKHTPTPWVVTTDAQGNLAVNNHNNFRSDFPLATLCHGMKEKHANAEFIVKACNNHYALLHALKEARIETYKLAQQLCPEQAGTFDAIWSLGGHIGKTIAQAESKTETA